MASAMQNVVRRLSIEATTRGVKEAEQAARGLSNAVDGVAVSGQRAERATQSMESRLASIQRRYDEQFRAQQALAKVERDLMQAQQQGLVTQQRRLELLSLAAERHGLATAAINREKAATDALDQSQKRLASNDNFRRRNLQFQLFDVGQGLAGGLNPALIAAQQGPQIVQMYAGAGGVNAALRDTVGLLTTVARGFGPVAVAAGVGALAISGMRSEIQDATGVAVTFGDVFKGVFQVIGRGIYDFLEPAISAIAPWFSQAWDLAKAATAEAFNVIIRIPLVAFETIKHGILSVPDAFIVAGEAAAQGFVDAIVWMGQEALTIINGMIAKINGVLRAAGFDKQIGSLNPVIERPTVDFGGAAAWERLTAGATAYQDKLQEIAATDYTGKFFDAVSDAAVANHKAAEEAEKNAGATKNSADAARKATDEWDGYRKVTEETTDAVREVESALDNMARDLSDTIGGALADLFSTDDMNKWFDNLMSRFAQIGQQNIANLFDFEQGGFWDQVKVDREGTKRAIQAGAEEGTQKGLIAAIQSLGVPEGTAKGVVGIGSAAIGGYGLGYQSGSSTMGAVGGALSGLAAGAPFGPIGMAIGAIVGAAAGLFGASSKKSEEKKAAQAELSKNRLGIETFIQASGGTGVGEYQQAYSEADKQNRAYQELASAAGDRALLRRLQDASNAYFNVLYREFTSGFDGMLNALRSGLGPNSPFIQAQKSIEGIREQLKGFVSDTKFLAEKSSALGGGNIPQSEIDRRVAEAQAAARQMLLRQLTGVETLSKVAAEMARIDGAAVALQRALEELGATSEQAAADIANAKQVAIGNLRTDFLDQLNRDINSFGGKDWINQFSDLLKETKGFQQDASMLGVGMDEVRRRFGLAAQQIVNDGNLTGEQVAELTARFGQAATDLGLSLSGLVANAEDAAKVFDRAGLQSKINDASGKGYLNQFGSLRTEVTGLMGSTNSLADIGLISQYSAAAARQIAESSGLSSEAIRGLATTFPLFGQTLLRVADDMDKAAEQAQRAEEASAAAAAAAARRAAILGLQPGLLERTQGQAAAQDWQLRQLNVGNASLAGIRGAGSIEEAKRQLDSFIATITRTGRTAEDISQAGQLGYAAFDAVAQALQQAAEQADSAAQAFQDMQTQVSDSLAQFGDRMTSEFERFNSQVLDDYRRQRGDFFDAASGANSFLNSIATQGTNPENQYQILLGRFRDAAALASTGNSDALRGLVSQGDSLLQAGAQFFPQGTRQFDDLLNEIRGAVTIGRDAAIDRGNEVSAKMDRFIAGQDKLLESMKLELAKVTEEVKGLKQGSVMLLNQIATLLASGKSDPETVRAIRDLVASNREVGDAIRAIGRRAAA